MKTLILGCGSNVEEREKDTTYLDISPFQNVDIVWNLDITPWPIEDNSFEYISAIHVVEHLESKLLPFMNECWRILQPGGMLYVVTPRAGKNVDLEFADPTHVRCYTTHSFSNYFTKLGLKNFAYTDKLWGNIHLQAPEDGPLKDCVVFEGMPIKKWW